MNPKPRVLVTRKLPDAVEARMAELFECEFNAHDNPLSAGELAQRARHCDVLVPTVTDRITHALLKEIRSSTEGSARLRLIASYGAGVDHIDRHAAESLGIVLANTPNVMEDDTADMAMALILCTTRRVVEGENLLREGNWKGWAPTALMGRRASGKKLGIIGMGRIGRKIARRARAFNLEVHYHNRRRLPEEVEQNFSAQWWEKLDAMLAHVDIVSINCPATEQTHHLINRKRLALMRPDAVLINTARGEIVDEEALADALDAGALDGVGLDVHEHAPTVNARLLRHDKAMLLPHMASATIDARLEMGERVIINIRAWHDGHQPPTALSRQFHIEPLRFGVNKAP